MYTSTYIPVNMYRENCMVCSNEKSFPADKLLNAYKCITGETVEGVSLKDNVVVFEDNPNDCWTIADVFCAHKAYQTALENNFSFYATCNKAGVPQLFISKPFKGCRILVNAFNMHSVLVTDKSRVAKLSSIIDKKLDSLYCFDLYNTMKALETGTGKYLSAVLVGRDSSDEYMCVSPMTALYSDVTTCYGADAIEELREIMNDNTLVTESFCFQDNFYVRHDLNNGKPMSKDFVAYLIEQYNRLKEKKSNYVEIVNDDYCPEMYYSTDGRYLVNAHTFECIVIRNQHTKKLLESMAAKKYNNKSELQLAWQLAKTE